MKNVVFKIKDVLTEFIESGNIKKFVEAAKKITAAAKKAQTADGIITSTEGNNNTTDNVKPPPVIKVLPMKGQTNSNINVIDVVDSTTKKSENPKDPDTIIVQPYKQPRKKG